MADRRGPGRLAVVLAAAVVAAGSVVVAHPVLASVPGAVRTSTGPTAADATGAAAAASRARVAAADDQLPEPQQDPATSRDKAREILDRPEFRRPEPGLFERAGRWLSEALGRLLDGLFTGGVGSALSWGILGLAIAAVALMVARVSRTVRREPTRPVPQVHVDVRRSPVDWRREAEALEAGQQWKAALRCRYRALVGELVAREVVPDLPGRTTGEYRADVRRARPELAADFGGASELFERAWYGDRPTGPDEAARFRSLADHVVERAGRPARHAEVELDEAAVGAW